MFISKDELERLRKEYPTGCKVELVRMNDIQAPPVGTKGVVKHVDDIGQIHVSWETGSSLAITYPEDECRRIP